MVEPVTGTTAGTAISVLVDPLVLCDVAEGGELSIEVSPIDVLVVAVTGEVV